MTNDATATTPGDPAQTATTTVGVPHLGFFLGSDLYSVPLTRLREVARFTRLRRIPGAAAHVAGLVNLRGEIVCALDTHGILGHQRAGDPDGGYLIALRDFDYPVGLVADSIADVFTIDPVTIEAPPEAWPSERAAAVTGVCAVAAGSMGIIDLDRVVNR
jgi:purine-binding chemotaxis protein CheW